MENHQRDAKRQRVEGQATSSAPTFIAAPGASIAHLPHPMQIQALQQQNHALTEERDSLQAKRQFWREEANTQRQVRTTRREGIDVCCFDDVSICLTLVCSAISTLPL
jgi:hypothetical protein